MLSVTCVWPDQQWALIIGLVREELDGIWMGAQMVIPIRRMPGVIAAPVLFVIMRNEDYHDEQAYLSMTDKLYEHYPEEDAIVPVILNEEARMALEDGQKLQFSSEKAFGATAPTGWKNCRHVEVRFKETEEQLVASLEGKSVQDLRPESGT